MEWLLNVDLLLMRDRRTRILSFMPLFLSFFLSFFTFSRLLAAALLFLTHLSQLPNGKVVPKFMDGTKAEDEYDVLIGRLVTTVVAVESTVARSGG